VELLVVKARVGPGGTAACQRLQPTLSPAGVPAADVLAGHAELAGDLGLGATDGKQLTGLHTDSFERLAVAQAAGVAAVGGWSHTAMLPGQPRLCRRNWRTSFNYPVDEIDQAVDELTARGVSILRYEGFESDDKGIHRGQGRLIAWFTDPAGNVLSVVQEG
jgi:predicted enzyme related to lactoylglutathione lyase